MKDIRITIKTSKTNNVKYGWEPPAKAWPQASLHFFKTYATTPALSSYGGKFYYRAVAKTECNIPLWYLGPKKMTCSWRNIFRGQSAIDTR